MNRSILVLFVAATSIAVCWAGLVPLRRLGETKAICQSYFQGNTGVPCWSLGSKCYCFSTNANAQSRLDWNNANQECRKEGMVMLSVESQEEDRLINSHIKATPALLEDYYWTSGRFSQEGKNRWEWATTEPFPQMNYTNWYPGYPNNSRPGSYAYINYNFPNGYWFNENGPAYILFICESMGDAVTTEAPASTPTSSPTPTVTSTTEESTYTTEESTDTTEESTDTTEESTDTTKESTDTTEESTDTTEESTAEWTSTT